MDRRTTGVCLNHGLWRSGCATQWWRLPTFPYHRSSKKFYRASRSAVSQFVDRDKGAESFRYAEVLFRPKVYVLPDGHIITVAQNVFASQK